VSRFLVAALAAAFLAGPVLADGPVPVRARVMKGARGGAAKFDERLADLKGQLSRLAYVRWEQTSEHRMDMRQGRTEFVELPGGDMIALTIMEVRGPTVTFEVGITQRNTQSRLTSEKGQRIVHQVTGEQGGAAYFVAVMPWP
jgi:hypothetical protein